MKTKNRLIYESPKTRCNKLHLEDGFMAGSADIYNPEEDGVGRINTHNVNDSFDATSTASGTWVQEDINPTN